jgi:hypothetical protein
VQDRTKPAVVGRLIDKNNCSLVHFLSAFPSKLYCSPITPQIKPLLQHSNARGTEKFAIHQVTSLMLTVDGAGLFSITLDHSHRLVNFWVEYFAFTFKGCDSVRFKKIVESLLDQAETVGDRI